MKQEIITYLSTIKDDIFNISKYLYENSEAEFKESKGCRYIINFLRNRNFKVTEKYMNSPNGFIASFGEGHPKIIFVCEYEADEALGHTAGNNLSCAISIGAGLCLSKVLPKLHKGSIVILGCSGNIMNNPDIECPKEDAFKSIDSALMVRPYLVTAQSGNFLNPINGFKANEALSRLFCHNLKESGIIDIKPPIDADLKLNLGCISNEVPAIQPLISIVKDSSIRYMTKEFAEATQSHFAKDQAIKAIQALALTGLDLIEKDDLISEAKSKLL